VSEALLSTDYTVMIRMSPTDSLFSDVMLRVPKQLEKVVLSLNEGDGVASEGSLHSQGGTFTHHTIDVVRLSKQ
jgi:hypothetical protein